jgi:hypothetical protein
MITTRRTSLALAAFFSIAATVAAAPAARAESKAWTAAKKSLPGNLQVVVGMNFGAIRSSQLFQMMWPMMIKQAGDAQTKLDAIKTSCGIDFVNALDSMVVGMDASEKGAVVLALKGTSQKDLEACLTKVAKADGKTAKITKAGPITQYSGMGGKDVYVKWLDKDVVELATQVEDKALLGTMTAGGVDKDKALKAPLASSKTDAAIWGVVNKAQDLDQLHAKMTLGYGSADVKSGQISTELHLVLDSAKAATDGAAQATQQLAAAKKSGQIPPAFASLLSSLQIKAMGPEMIVSAAMAEKDVLGLITQFAMGGGKTP